MKQKRKLVRKLLSVLLTLALVLGLMPGMGLTAYAAEQKVTFTAGGTNNGITVSPTMYNYETFFVSNKGQNVSISSSNYNITKLVLTDKKLYSGQWGDSYLGASAGNVSFSGDTMTVTGINAKTVTIQGNNSKYATISSIDVYYDVPDGYSVTINPGSNMTKTDGSGAESQSDLSGAMAGVVYTANDGYYFPEGYSVTAVNGITVTRNSYTQITVSGTPTADATITLTAPTAKTTPDAPTTAASVNCTTAGNNDGKLTGVTTAMEYKKSDADSWTAGTGSDITGLVSGTYYVRYKATDTTNASGNQELSIAGYTAPTYEVTYNVVNGTWSDDSTTDKKETVQSGSKPVSVPTSMKAASGYTGGAWDTDPADATITGATTFTYTFTALPTYEVTYKVVNGTWLDDSTTDKTETVQSGSKPASVPTGMKAASGYTGGSWDNDPTDATITGATTFTYTFTAVPTYTVTYKVVNGTWSDGSTADKTENVADGATPTGVPTGMIASSGYTGGAWDTNPADATITEATTFTYTFTAVGTISKTVTFKVVNGSWNDESVAEKTVTLTGAEGTTLKLSADQIPAVGNKPNEGYKEGMWDTTPVADTEITANTTYTYTYAAKESSPDPDPTPDPEPEPEPTPEGGDSAIDSTGDTPVEIPKENQLSRDEIEDIIKQTGESVAPTDNIKLVVEANSKSASAVPSDEAEELNNNKEIKNGDVKIGAFVEIELAYLINNVRKGTISNPNKAVTFYVSVPASMVADGRTYFVYRIHKSGGTVTVTLVGSSSTPNVPVSSDEFSTYAIGYSTTVSAGSSAPAHTHVYEWTVIKEATESDDGCMAYACKTCGATLYQVPISAYYVFNKSAMEQIEKAHQGATVSIVTDRWISFHKMVLEALNKRPDVTLKVSFLDGEYRGDMRGFTIPAGTNALSYAADTNFAGFMYIASQVGYDY